MSIMVELQLKAQRGWKNPRSAEMSLTKSLPFYRSRQGHYVHRVRSGTVYFYDNVAQHTSFRLWCGQIGSVGVTLKYPRHRPSKGDLFSDVPKHAVLCATCEGRAVGAGQLGSRMICGRIVRFSPRDTSTPDEQPTLTPKTDKVVGL